MIYTASARIASRIAAMPSQLASQVSKRRKQTSHCDKSLLHRGQIAKTQIELRRELASQHMLLQRPSVEFIENLQAARNYNKNTIQFRKNVVAKRGYCYLTRIFDPFASIQWLCLFSAASQKPHYVLSPKATIKIERIAPRTRHDTHPPCHGNFRGKKSDLERSSPLHRSHIAATSVPHRWITGYRQMG